MIKRGILIAVFFFIPLIGFAIDVTPIIQNYPMYQDLEQSQEISQQFIQYMKFLSDKAPDGKMVYSLMASNTRTLDALSTILHEKVEFVGWLNLKHQFEDILNVKYYQTNYMQVYPIAHRNALVEELNFIKFFAQKKGFRNLPEITYVLTSPILEHFDDPVPVAKFLGRLKFSPEYQAQLRFIQKKDLDTALEVYEAGGYTYQNKKRILSESLEEIKKALK